MKKIQITKKSPMQRFRVIKQINNNFFRISIFVLQLIINLIFNHQINSDLISHTVTPLYYLICCYQEQYQQIVQDVISSQENTQIAERLAAAFTELTANIALNGERVTMIKFKDNFDKFIVNIQGFLIVK